MNTLYRENSETPIKLVEWEKTVPIFQAPSMLLFVAQSQTHLFNFARPNLIWDQNVKPITVRVSVGLAGVVVECSLNTSSIAKWVGLMLIGFFIACVYFLTGVHFPASSMNDRSHRIRYFLKIFSPPWLLAKRHQTYSCNQTRQ